MSDAITNIDQAFIQAFLDGNFGLPIADENLRYKPDGGAYAELLQASNDVLPRGLSDTDETSGVFAVILRYPANSGSIEAKTKADSIMSVFKIGTQVCRNDVCATVMGRKRQAGVPEDGWFKIVVTIRYRSFLRR